MAFPLCLSQFHFSIFTGSIHTASVCCSCPLNLNVGLRLLSRRIVGSHQEYSIAVYCRAYYTWTVGFSSGLTANLRHLL